MENSKTLIVIFIFLFSLSMFLSLLLCDNNDLYIFNRTFNLKSLYNFLSSIKKF